MPKNTRVLLTITKITFQSTFPITISPTTRNGDYPFFRSMKICICCG